MIVMDPETTKELAGYRQELNDLRAQDAWRLGRMTNLQELVEQFRRRDMAGTISDYGRQVTGTPLDAGHDIRLPYLLATVIKHTHRVSAKVPDVRVPRGDSTLQERFRQYAIERWLGLSWQESDADVVVQDAAWDASITGAAAFEVDYDVSRHLGCFYPRDPAGLVIVPDPVKVWPYRRVYRSWTTPLASVIATYGNADVNPLDESWGTVEVQQLVPAEGGDQDVARCTVHEVVTATHKIRWSGQSLLLYLEHGFGICPFVVVPNVGPRRRLWGFSDVEMILDSAFYYQSLFSGQADVMDFVAKGTYLEEATGQAAAAIQDTMKTGGIIPSREGGKLEPVQPADQPAFAGEHIAAARRNISELGFVPWADWGGEAASQASSGSERGMMLQPSVELARLKQGNLAWALARVNEVMMRIAEKKVDPRDGLTYRGRVRISGQRDASFKLKLGGQVQDGLLPKEFQGVTETALPTLIDGDYQSNVVFTDRLDVYDSQYVMTELNKFQQGVQSLRTTLENTGCIDPENEILQIDQEAQDYPYLRQGAMKLIELQIAQMQAQQGGGPDPGGGFGATPPDQPPGGGPAAGLDAMGAGADGSQGGSQMDGLQRALSGSQETGRANGAVRGVPGGAY